MDSDSQTTRINEDDTSPMDVTVDSGDEQVSASNNSTLALLNPLIQRTTAAIAGWSSRTPGTNAGNGNSSIIDPTGSGISVSNSRSGTPAASDEANPQDREKALRKRILLIHKDETMSASDKARKIQASSFQTKYILIPSNKQTYRGL